MGATCSPSEPADENEEEVAANMECEEEQDEGGDTEQTNEKFASILNDYQAENEQLRKDLESLKNTNDENILLNEEKTKQNEEVMRELNEMKALMDVKSRVIARGRLEAALLKSIVSMESAKNMCINGDLVYHRMNRKVTKYVEIHVCEGAVLENEYKSGYVMLTHSDDKNAEIAERFNILKVVDEVDNKEKGHIFTLKVSDEDGEKNISFSCKTAKRMGDWIQAIKRALADVKSAYDHMYEQFTLKLEFSKEKMGIRVEESLFLPDEDDDEKSEREKLRESGVVTKAIKNIEKGGKKTENDAMKTLEKVAEEMGKGVIEVFGNEKPEEEVCEKKEEKSDEPPCELLVTNIFDEDLIAAGLKVNCVVVALNDKPLAGTYTDQLDLLLQTPKPYILTFKGENYLKHKPQAKHGYHSILKEITADVDNSVKRAFHELVEGTHFERELKTSSDQKETIEKLLSNQRRLMALLRKSDIQDVEL